MTLYAYSAKDLSGKRTADTIEAESIKAAALKLHAAGLYPVTIAPHAKRKGWKQWLGRDFSRVSHAEITMFTSRLADLLHGGMPLVRALGVLERQTGHPKMRGMLSVIAGEVQDGGALSAALGKYPACFPDLYIGVIQAGETAGLLEPVLRRISEFYEKEEDLRHRIQAALAYPLVMLGVGFLSVLFLLTFVIPKFEVMFREMGQVLPLPTRILLLLSTCLQHGWWIYVPLFLAGIVFLRVFLKSAEGKQAIDRLKLRLPLAGDLIAKELVSRFVRMLSALLKNGVPILDALLLVQKSAGNRVLAAEINAIYVSVREGKGLVVPMRASRFFPPIVADMVAIGEETGNLDGSLVRVAEIYEREVTYAVKTLTSLIEPAIILVVGLLIGFVAVAMLLPVFQISAGIR